MRRMFILPLLIIFLFPNHKLASIDNELTSNALLTSLAPVITEQIQQYYGYEKQYHLYSTEIKKLKRDNSNGYHFFITLKVTTFEEGHLPPYGQDQIVLDLSPIGTQLITYKHKGDDVEKAVNQFYRTVSKDIEHSFKKKWRTYHKTRYRQFHYIASKNVSDHRLMKVTQLVNNMTEEKTSMYKNTIQPLVYYNEEEILILFKNNKGMNEMISMRKSGTEWIISGKEQKQGKKMTEQIFSHM